MSEEGCSASRRSFLKALPLVTAGAAIPSLGAQAPDARHQWAMLVDIRQCIGCQACTVSCFMENAVPEDNYRTIVSTYAVEQVRDGKKEIGTFMLPRLCNHCSNPPCVPVCPVGATFKQPDGEVVGEESAHDRSNPPPELDDERSLTNDEVNDQVDTIVSALGKAHQATLRV